MVRKVEVIYFHSSLIGIEMVIFVDYIPKACMRYGFLLTHIYQIYAFNPLDLNIQSSMTVHVRDV